MNISELSIRRPVLATVLTIIILLFGFIGYNFLGVREYPSVDNPIISVSCFRNKSSDSLVPKILGAVYGSLLKCSLVMIRLLTRLLQRDNNTFTLNGLVI